jgi:hypothetical protein
VSIHVFTVRICTFSLLEEEFEYIKGVIRIEDRQYNDQKDKQRSTKHYTDN